MTNEDIIKKIAKLEVRLEYIEKSIDDIKKMLVNWQDKISQIENIEKRIEDLEEIRDTIIKQIFIRIIITLTTGGGLIFLIKELLKMKGGG